jgi:hypothetical protein
MDSYRLSLDCGPSATYIARSHGMNVDKTPQMSRLSNAKAKDELVDSFLCLSALINICSRATQTTEKSLKSAVAS